MSPDFTTAFQAAGLGLESGAIYGMMEEAIRPDSRAASKTSSWRLKPMDISRRK